MILRILWHGREHLNVNLAVTLRLVRSLDRHVHRICADLNRARDLDFGVRIVVRQDDLVTDLVFFNIRLRLSREERHLPPVDGQYSLQAAFEQTADRLRVLERRGQLRPVRQVRDSKAFSLRIVLDPDAAGNLLNASLSDGLHPTEGKACAQRDSKSSFHLHFSRPLSRNVKSGVLQRMRHRIKRRNMLITVPQPEE